MSAVKAFAEYKQDIVAVGSLRHQGIGGIGNFGGLIVFPEILEEKKKVYENIKEKLEKS